MDKRILLLTASFLVLVIGGVVYLINSDMDAAKKSATRGKDRPAQQQSVTENSNQSAEGRYVEYKDGQIENTAGTKLLFFHASWCPQCRALEADIKENTIPENVTIMKVDYDTNQDLRKQYGVTIQTTIVRVDDRGQLVEKYVAYDEPTLANVIKELL